MIALLLAAATAAGAPATPAFRGILFPAPPPPIGGRYVEWAATPSADQLAKAYPKGATGRQAVALNCTVGDMGQLGPCSIWAQVPAGDALAKAAQGLTQYFRLTPEFADAARQYQTRVSFTLVLTPPGEPDAPFADGACPPPFCSK